VSDNSNDIIALVQKNILAQLRAGLSDGVDDETPVIPVPAATLKEAVNFVKFLEQRGKGGDTDALKTAIDRQRKALRLTGGESDKKARTA